MGTTSIEQGSRSNGARADGDETNVARLERVASVAAGGALAAYALRQRGVTGLVAGVVGGLLVERGMTGHCRLYAATGMSTAGEDGDAASGRAPVKQRGARAVLDASSAQRVERSATVSGKSAVELYAFWRDFENLPRIMEHLERVEVVDDQRSRWTAKAPAGRTVEWDAEIHNDVPNELIAWRSLPGADVKNAGSVRFRELPHGRGTEVHVTLEYDPPAGRLGAAVAKLFGEDPDTQVREDLRRFKQLMEAGELAVSEIPGQGERARYREFNALASNDPDVRASAPAAGTPHEPAHVPTPSDASRGSTTTQQSEGV